MESKKVINVGSILWGVIAVAVIAVVVYFVIKKTKKSKEQKEYEAQTEAKVNYSNLSMTKTEFTDLANKLYRAVKGLGTTTDHVYEVFNALQTDSDLEYLKLIFGTKDDMNLVEWMYDDLSKKELQRVNKILSDKGIGYSFYNEIQ